MSEKKRSLIPFIIIVAVGLLLAFASFQFLQSNSTTVYLFKDHYKAGTKITKEMLTSQEVDKRLVDAVVAARKSQSDGVYITPSTIDQIVKDGYLQFDVVKGTPLMSIHSDKFGGSPAEKRLNPDMVGLSIAINNDRAGTPHIKPDSRVNVIAGFSNRNGSQTEELVLQNIRVLDVTYNRKDDSKTGSPDLPTVTLEVTPEQSLKLAHAEEFGKIRLAIVKAGNYKDVEAQPYSREATIAPEDTANKK